MNCFTRKNVFLSFVLAYLDLSINLSINFLVKFYRSDLWSFSVVHQNSAALARSAEILSFREKFPAIPERNRNTSESSASASEVENRTKARFQIGSHESDIHIHSADERDSNPDLSSQSAATLTDDPRQFDFSNVGISVVVLPHTPEAIDGPAFISLHHDSDVEIML